MAKVVQERIMGVSADALRRVILDFEKYPEFLSEVVSAKPKQAHEGFQRVEFEIEVVRRFQYTLEFDFTSENRIRWRLLDSNFFTTNDGAWILNSVAEKKTQVQYELNVGVKFLIPGFVAKKLTEVNLPRLLDSFENRAKHP
jgi:ribosome-associated toxin RatA of RatAB toxin-antitoxin module